jgi:hypothetical protein
LFVSCPFIDRVYMPSNPIDGILCCLVSYMCI